MTNDSRLDRVRRELYGRMALGVLLPLAGLALFVAGLDIAAAVLLLVSAALAAPLLVMPLMVLGRNRRPQAGMSQ